MHRPRALFPSLVLALLATTATTSAQGVDLTLFLGRAYPISDDRLTLRPTVPSIPGVEVTETGRLELRTAGGPVFGGAVAFELGIFGIEGRIDATDIGFDLSGARYDLLATMGPFPGLTGSVTVGDGRFDIDRLYLLSVNGRLRTPGPVALVASGGLSYLPEIVITGSVPLAVQVPVLPPVPGVEPRLRLRVAPDDARRRFGLNGGAGLRVGGRVAVMGEVRVFYFREHSLRFGAEGTPAFVTQILDNIDPVRFEPVIVNAQAGLVFRF